MQGQYQPETPFLNKPPLTNKMNRLAKKQGLKAVTDDTTEFMSQAVQIYMRSVAEHLIKIAQYRTSNHNEVCK
jgi:histone H3/H4